MFIYNWHQPNFDTSFPENFLENILKTRSIIVACSVVGKETKVVAECEFAATYLVISFAFGNFLYEKKIILIEWQQNLCTFLLIIFEDYLQFFK